MTLVKFGGRTIECSLVPEDADLWHYIVKVSSKILVSETDANKNGWRLTTCRPAVQSVDSSIKSPASLILTTKLQNDKRTAERKSRGGQE